MKRDVVVVGATGLLGSAVFRALERSGARAKAVGWQQAEAELAHTFALDVVIASGLTDPKLPAERLRDANFEFSKKIIAAAGSGARFLTLGTVHERFPELARTNPYLASKVELGRWMQEQASRRPGAFLHLRLHTVYGTRFAPHLFLGQMLEAIRARKEFRMSSGDQLREYHHADDVAQAITGLLGREWGKAPVESSVLEVNSGQAIRLGDLAREIFAAFDCEELLQIGAVARAPAENVSVRFERSPKWLLPESREPIAGVIAALRGAIARA